MMVMVLVVVTVTKCSLAFIKLEDFLLGEEGAKNWKRSMPK